MKYLLLILIAVLAALAYLTPVQSSEAMVPAVPTCYTVEPDEILCIDQTNSATQEVIDKTATAQIVLTIGTPFEPTDTPVPPTVEPTATATIEIQPINRCVIATCIYLPYVAK